MQVSLHFQLSLKLIHQVIFFILNINHAFIFLILWRKFLFQVHDNVVFQLINVLVFLSDLFFSFLQ